MPLSERGRNLIFGVLLPCPRGNRTLVQIVTCLNKMFFCLLPHLCCSDISMMALMVLVLKSI